MYFQPWLVFIHYLSLVWAEEIREPEVDERRCAGNQKRRLVCAENIEENHCHVLGCCYDTDTRKCYYPGVCRKLLTTAGGYSAMLLLPGQDPDQEESLSMLEGGNWCSRNAVIGEETTTLQTDLQDVYKVYSVISRSKQDRQTEAFSVRYSVDGREWTDNQALNGTSHEIGGSSSVTSVFYARHVTVQPAWTVRNPCVRLDIVICPGKPARPPAPPDPPEAGPRVIEDEYLPDERPSAIAMGSLGIILVTSVVAFLLLLDLPTYRHDLKLARRNIKSYIKYRNSSHNPMRPVQRTYRTKYIVEYSNNDGAEQEALHSLILDSNS